MKSILTFIFLCFIISSFSQDLSSEELLDKAINYHDPDSNWETFDNEFIVVMSTPKSLERKSVITINFAQEYFGVKAVKDTITTNYILDKDKCRMSYNGIVLDSIAAVERKMSCDRASLYKNYYTYLYGLPMKLKDSGTNLSDKVEQKTFKGKDYLVLKVTYDEAVGSDVWYFYFDPKTYAMEIYQFFKTDDNGIEKPDSGEYIILSDEAVVNGIKMPKVRAWYYNKNDVYLGTDSIVED